MKSFCSFCTAPNRIASLASIRASNLDGALFACRMGSAIEKNIAVQRDKIKAIPFSIVKYSDKEELKRQLPKDVPSGVIVAVVAPLYRARHCVGVSPEQGLYTAIVAGFLIAFLDGSRVQISGPTAAFTAIVASIVATDVIDGLVAATIIAGILLSLMSLFKLGTLIRFVPCAITTGFTADIAVTRHRPDGGLPRPHLPHQDTDGRNRGKPQAVAQSIGTMNWQAFAEVRCAPPSSSFGPR